MTRSSKDVPSSYKDIIISEWIIFKNMKWKAKRLAPKEP